MCCAMLAWLVMILQHLRTPSEAYMVNETYFYLKHSLIMLVLVMLLLFRSTLTLSPLNRAQLIPGGMDGGPATEGQT